MTNVAESSGLACFEAAVLTAIEALMRARAASDVRYILNVASRPSGPNPGLAQGLVHAAASKRDARRSMLRNGEGLL